MKRYYLVQVEAVRTPMVYVSANNFNRLLDACLEKRLTVSVHLTLNLKSDPDYDGRPFKQLLDIVSKSV